MYIYVQFFFVCVWIYFFIPLEMEMLSHRIDVVFSFLRNCQSFPKGVVPFYTFTDSV